MSSQKLESKVAANSKATQKNLADVKKPRRLNLHDVILGAIQELGDKASPQGIEQLGQKVKHASKGKYEAIAKSEYILTKEGIVRPQLSDLGYKRAINFWNRNFRWVIPKQFQDHIKDKAKELRLEIKEAPKKK
ncbi:MAG: hypothetical protein PXY39_08895 [archaeon]|nr:hypothetical protein [archaeon]